MKISGIRNFIISFAKVIIISIGIATITGFFGTFYWIADLFSHFRVQYSGLLFFAAILLLILRSSKVFAIASLLFIVINLWTISPYFKSNNNKIISGKNQLKIAAINVLSINKQTQELIEFINKEDPDIILMQEFTEQWENELKDFLSKYPFQHVINRKDDFGIALVSKMVPSDLQVINFSDSSVPSLLAFYKTDNTEFGFLGTHPVPPASGKTAEYRNEQLKNIVKSKELLGEKYIIAGDLNITPYSPFFTEFKEGLNLTEGRENNGLQPSWPACCWWFKIPIDHILVSSNIEVVDFYTGRYTGSDHLPVVAIISL